MFERRIAIRYIIPIFLSFLSVPLLRLNFTSFSFQDFDILQLLPFSGWLYLFVLSAIGLVYFHIGDGKSSIYYTISVSFALNISYFLAQYPSFPHWDYFLHSKTANQILNEGRVPIAGSAYYKYPGTFLLINGTALILGLDVLRASFLLYCLFILLVSVIIYVMIPKYISLKLKALVISIVSYFILMFHRHFCPANYATALFLLLANRVFRNYEGKKRTNLLIILLLSFVIIASHPLTTIFLLSFFTILVLADMLRRPLMYGRNSIKLVFLTTLIFFLSWHVYIATQFMEETIKHIYDSVILGYEAPQATEHLNIPIFRWLTSVSPIVLVFSLYKWSIYIAFFTLIFISFIRTNIKKKNASLLLRLLIFWGIGIILSGAFFLALPTPWLERIIIPLLLVAVLMLAQNMKNNHIKFFYCLTFIPILIIPSFIATRPPYFIYSFHPYEYYMFVHSWEIRTQVFLNTYQANPLYTIASDLQTVIIHSYYNPFSRSSYVSCGADFTSIYEENPKIYEGDYIIRSQRQEATSFSAQNLRLDFWQKVDQNLNSDPFFVKFYDNAYSKIYFRSVIKKQS